MPIIIRQMKLVTVVREDGKKEIILQVTEPVDIDKPVGKIRSLTKRRRKR